MSSIATTQTWTIRLVDRQTSSPSRAPSAPVTEQRAKPIDIVRPRAKLTPHEDSFQSAQVSPFQALNFEVERFCGAPKIPAKERAALSEVLGKN